MSIDDDRRVLEVSTGVDQIVFNSGGASHFDATVNASGDGNPAAVADGGDELPAFGEIADDLQDLGIATQLVRHEPAWNHDSVEIRSSNFFDCRVRYARISILAGIAGAGSWPRYDNLSSGLEQSQPRIPEFQIFICITDEDQHALTGEWKGRRHGFSFMDV